MQVEYVLIDPRPASKESQVEKLNELKRDGYALLGFEVSIPHYAEMMTVNWDPQHIGGNADCACIEQIFNIVRSPYQRLPWSDEHAGDMDKIAFCTVRADLDSVGGMAVMLAWLGSDSSYMYSHFAPERVEAVAKADKFECGEWAPKGSIFEGTNSDLLAAPARMCADFKRPLEERVAFMLKWLENGSESWISSYRESYEYEKGQIIAAMESGETTCQKHFLTGISSTQYCAVVKSTFRAATSIGYCEAPVVVAINPTFSFGGGEPHRKVTICQYQNKYVDLKGVFAELGEGWGGSPTIGGSPQGVDCQTSVNEILAAITNNLL